MSGCLTNKKGFYIESTECLVNLFFNPARRETDALWICLDSEVDESRQGTTLAVVTAFTLMMTGF